MRTLHFLLNDASFNFSLIFSSPFLVVLLSLPPSLLWYSSVCCCTSEPRQPSACISPWKKIMVIFLESLCFVPIFFFFLQMLHTLLRSTKCMSVKAALLLFQVDVYWILFHVTLKAQRMNDMNCRCWEKMHRPECYRQIQTRLFWIDHEWAKSQRGSWTCSRAWQA